MVQVVRQTSVGGGASELAPTSREPPAFQDPANLRYLGDYELLGEVGRGGMGVVYKARQVSLNRIVALKVIAPEQLASPKAIERFRTEAGAAANLDHPNIVPIYETGERDGRHYFSMKLIEGRSLALRIADFRLPGFDSKSGPGARPSSKSQIANQQFQLAHLLAQVADAVHYAHQRGILHRDLKPGNILIDSEGRAHVTDFGLAKLVEGDSSLTLSGEVLGTPAYMAPEQAAGKASQITIAADVYSLGVILYELLTGRPPFARATPIETLHAVLHEDPPAPHSLNRFVARDLETICLKCLEREPGRRYLSAQEFAEELHRFARGEPIQARAATPTEKAWRWCRRKPALATTLALLHLILAFGLAGILWQWRRAEANAVASRQNELASRENLYAADINLAHQALQADNLPQALDLLRRHVPKPGEPDLRGFEWRYLWQQCQSDELFTLAGHAYRAVCAVFSPDGRTLATASGDNTIKVWDLASRRAIATITNQIKEVRSLSLSPKGDLLAAGCQTSVFVWDTKSFRPLRSLPGAIAMVRFSPVGDYLITASTNGLILWDTREWRIVRTLEVSWRSKSDFWGPTAVDLGLAFSPDGSIIGVPTHEGIQILGVPDLQDVALFRKIIPGLRFFSLSSDRHTLATCTDSDNNVKLWNIASQAEVGLCSGHSDSVNAMAFSPDGTRLATCSSDQTIKLWDVASATLIRAFRGNEAETWNVTFSQDGNLLASTSKDGLVKLWNSVAKVTHDVAAKSVRPLGFTSDGNFLALATNETLMVFDPETFQQRATREYFGNLGESNARFGELLCGGRILPVLTRNSPGSKPGLQLWDLIRHQLVCTVDAMDPFPSYAQAKQLLATFTSNNTVSVWQLPQGVLKGVLTNCMGRAGRVVFSPDEALLASGTTRGGVTVWTVGENQLHELVHLGTTVNTTDGLAFSADCRTLASCEWDGSIGLWAIPSGQRIATLTGHKRAGGFVSFSPDGRTLTSAADDGTVRFWHVATQRELMRFEIPMSGLGNVSLGFSPDGRAIFVSRNWRLTQVWYAPAFAEIALAEGKDYGSLAQTPADWHAVGRELEKRSRVEEAVKAFSEVVQRSASNPTLESLHNNALLHRAKLFTQQGRFAQAGVDNCMALRLPARDPRAPATCIDLSAYFNGSLDSEPMAQSIPARPFLDNLPRGFQSLPGSSGFPFDLRGVIQLNHADECPGLPRSIEGIGIRQKCHRLHFLQATELRESEDRAIGMYVIHFADGTHQEVPILYGQDLREWTSDSGAPRLATVAWQGTNSDRGAVRLFEHTWKNPRPEMELRTLDFTSKMTKCAPFLIAITAEP